MASALSLVFMVILVIHVYIIQNKTNMTKENQASKKGKIYRNIN